MLGFAISERIVAAMERALSPLVSVFVGIADPILYLMIVFGCILIMLGKKRKGLEVLRWAAIGYGLLRFAPAIMALIKGIVDEMVKIWTTM